MSKSFDVVTGGAGFIGSHLVEALLEKGLRVLVVDDFSSGKMDNLDPLSQRFRGMLEVLEEDVRHTEQLSTAFVGADRVFHLAAMTSVEESVRNPGKVNEINVGGTVSVLSAACRQNVKKVVFASSTAVYGNSEELPKHEGMIVEPASPYAVSKSAGELYCSVFDQLYRLPTVCLRFFNVFGPRQDPASPYAAVIPRFVARLLDNQPPIVFGDGNQTRDFVYVKDVVQANILAGESSARGVSVNVASGRSYSLNEVIEILGRLVGREVEAVFEAARTGEVRHSSASIERGRRLLGFEPQCSFEEGLSTTLNWYRTGVS